MDRINKILNHEKFIFSIQKNETFEKERTFCKHGFKHLIDVSRIAYIISLEENIPICKDIIYAAGLLHDIGKHIQYEKKIPHNEAAIDIAKEILYDCNYNETEIKNILKAIYNHRQLLKNDEDILCRILYRADKLSRNCFICAENNNCDWEEDKKNKKILL